MFQKRVTGGGRDVSDRSLPLSCCSKGFCTKLVTSQLLWWTGIELRANTIVQTRKQRYYLYEYMLVFAISVVLSKAPNKSSLRIKK